jgi:hypothetical protein
MSDFLGPQGAAWTDNGIGVFRIGASPIGTRPILNPWATVLSQYANSPTIVQLIINMDQYIDPTANIDAFYDLLWNVNTAQGYGLDVWGRIVGIGRVLEVASGTYFGYEGPSGASGVGYNQAPFYAGESLTANYALLDGPYLALILAKALFNICNGTIQAINQIMVNLFGANGPLAVPGNCYCTDGENMTMTYVFGGPLNPVQTAIVYQSGVLPRPAGVAATVVIA